MKKPTSISTWEELAKAAKTTSRTIRHWRKNPAWGFELPLSRADVPAIIAWRDTYIATGGVLSADPSLTKRRLELQIKKLAAEVKTINHRLDRDRDQFVDRHVHRGALVGFLQLVRGELDRWCEALPAALAGLGVVEVREVIRDRRDAFYTRMTRHVQINLASDEEVAALAAGDGAKNPHRVKAGHRTATKHTRAKRSARKK